MSQLIDYTHQFPDSLIAQGRDSNFIRITKLDSPFQRADRKMASFELEYRWLSRSCENEDDDNYACVKGQEFTYWQSKEIKKLLSLINDGKEVNVFEHFSLL